MTQEWKDGDVTPGGSDIIMEGEPNPAAEDGRDNFAEAIDAHLETYFGAPDSVFHEIVSGAIHLDVLTFPPDASRDHWLYVTSGMSELPMTVHDRIENDEFCRAELVIGLPGEWGCKLQGADPTDDAWAPIKLLKWLARYPHEAGTWFAAGHTIPTEFSGASLQGRAPFTGAILTPPVKWPKAAQTFTLPNGQRLNFLAVHPLFEEEMALKLEQGTDALYDAMDRHDLDHVFRLTRGSLTERKKFLGLF